MKEKHLFKLASMLLVILMSLAMVMSCSKDDDEPNKGNNENANNSTYNNNSNNSTSDTPQYERKTCLSCRGDGDCFSCGGTGKCSACDGKGETGSGTFIIKCVRCNGKRICKYCDGLGYCKYCDGLGYTEVEVKPSSNNNNNNSSSSEEYTSIKAVKISAVKLSTGEWDYYSASVVDMYKRIDLATDGRPTLYTRSKSMIGIASINSDSKCGDEKVSGFTYKILTDVSLNSKTYYYFN